MTDAHITLVISVIIPCLVGAGVTLWGARWTDKRAKSDSAADFHIDSTGQIIDSLEAFVARLQNELARLEEKLGRTELALTNCQALRLELATGAEKLRDHIATIVNGKK